MNDARESERKYNIIYADPPWKFDNEQDRNPARGGATYDKMPLEEICSMPVASIAAKHSALFLWVPRAKIVEGLTCMSSWGFNYVTTTFTWVKLNKCGFVVPSIDCDDPKGREGLFLGRGLYSGLGYWVNGNTEMVLFGKRGAPKRKCKKVKEVILAPVGRHSAKPPETRDRIVELMGELSRIELFARGEAAEGWDVWGKEAKDPVKHLFGYTAADDSDWKWW